jgi:hypothetical protein
LYAKTLSRDLYTLVPQSIRLYTVACNSGGLTKQMNRNEISKTRGGRAGVLLLMSAASQSSSASKVCHKFRRLSSWLSMNPVNQPTCADEHHTKFNCLDSVAPTDPGIPQSPNDLATLSN